MFQFCQLNSEYISASSALPGNLDPFICSNPSLSSCLNSSQILKWIVPLDIDSGEAERFKGLQISISSEQEVSAGGGGTELIFIIARLQVCLVIDYLIIICRINIDLWPI